MRPPAAFGFVALVSVSASFLPSHAAEMDPLNNLPSKTPSWTGAYLGGYGAFTGGRSDWSLRLSGTVVGEFSHPTSSYAGGIEAGFDWEQRNFVFGTQVGLDRTSDTVDAELQVPGAGIYQIATGAGWLGTAQLRAGIPFGRTLAYGQGGIAILTRDRLRTPNPADPVSGASIKHSRAMQHGFTVGGGIEHRLTPRISLGLEYSYIHLKRQPVARFGVAKVYVEPRRNRAKASMRFRF